jgi:hypothetical protein
LAVHVARVGGVGCDWLCGRIRELAVEMPERHIAVLVLGGDTLDWWDELLSDLELDEDLSQAFRDVTLKRWDTDALRFWLDDVQIPVTSRLERERVQRATGGWPILLPLFLRAAYSQDRQLDAAIDRVSADPEFLAPVVDGLQLDRIPGLRRAAESLAQTGEAMDAATLAAWVEQEFSLADAQHLLDLLVLAQAGVLTRDGGDLGGWVQIEPCLGRALTPDL